MADYAEGKISEDRDKGDLRTRGRIDRIDKEMAVLEDKIAMLKERLGPIMPPELATTANTDPNFETPPVSEIDFRLDQIVITARRHGTELLALMNRINL